MDREELGRRVDELAGREDFVNEVERLAAGLTPEERELLGAVLLDRAGHVEAGVRERVIAPGWLRRQLEKLDDGRRRGR